MVEKYKNCVIAFLKLMDNRMLEIGSNIFCQNNKTNNVEIEDFKKWLLQYTTRHCLEYIDFIKMTNGFCYNTGSFYSLNPNAIVGSHSLKVDKTFSNSIYKQNEIIWQNEKLGKILEQYIVFADDEFSFYCLHRNDGIYYRIDRVNGNIVGRCETFYELIQVALEVSLYSSDSDYDEEYEIIKRKYEIE
jgi:hypothetical protein